MAFMISRETENVRSASEVEEAFRAITDAGKQAFVSEEELYQVRIENILHYVLIPYPRLNLMILLNLFLRSPVEKLLCEMCHLNRKSVIFA